MALGPPGGLCEELLLRLQVLEILRHHLRPGGRLPSHLLHLLLEILEVREVVGLHAPGLQKTLKLQETLWIPLARTA